MTTTVKNIPSHLTNAHIAHRVASRLATQFGYKLEEIAVRVQRLANGRAQVTISREQLPELMPVVVASDPKRSAWNTVRIPRSGIALFA